MLDHGCGTDALGNPARNEWLLKWQKHKKAPEETDVEKKGRIDAGRGSTRGPGVTVKTDNPAMVVQVISYYDSAHLHLFNPAVFSYCTR